MESFHGSVLCVDVGQRSVQEERVDDAVFQEFLGGKGLGSHLLVNNTQAGFEPYSPDSVIVFATGPVTDTRVFGSSRYGVYCRVTPDWPVL